MDRGSHQELELQLFAVFGLSRLLTRDATRSSCLGVAARGSEIATLVLLAFV